MLEYSQDKTTEVFTMNRTQQEYLSKDLLRYGFFKADITTDEKDGCRRIRVIEYQGKKYFHHMFNGELIEVFEV